MITVTPKELTKLLKHAIKSKVVPMVKSSPGVGKSEIVQQVAKVFKLLVIDLRLSQCEPTDLNGYPDIDKNKAAYIPFNTFPLENDDIPKGYKGWLLFLDEFTSATQSVQAAAYKLILDKAVGQFPLHKNVVIVCAGNLVTDMAFVTRKNTAIQSRLTHLSLVSSAKDWIEWATTQKIDHRIISYIEYNNDALDSFEVSKNNETYSCPRTWVFIHKLINKEHKVSIDMLPLLAGTIGEGGARSFFGFLSVYDDLPTVNEIMTNPLGTKVPEELSSIFALTGTLAKHMTVDKVEDILSYVKRLPEEYQIVTMQKAFKITPDILDIDVVDKWLSYNSSTVFY